MKEGGAEIIINEFEIMGGYKGNRQEMLNSNLIIDYIEKNRTLAANKAISHVTDSIKVERKRIKNGI